MKLVVQAKKFVSVTNAPSVPCPELQLVLTAEHVEVSGPGKHL